MVSRSHLRPGRALAATLALAGLLPLRVVADSSPADRAVAAAEAEVERAPSPTAHVALATAFLRKARESGDPAY
ncbi:MAG TPA: hypothetical protein VKA21_14685, partial [Candidatus Binatia bacterium]|nr:hypothetical protein [Candidatus Binatia bacterium]